MIPKIIHYCWFGGKTLPELALKCIESWRKYLPDYEIREWNESNFDVNINQFTYEAYTLKQYAFVSDFARFWILYNYGGLYFDIDVELINPLDDIIAQGAFVGMEPPYKKKKGLWGVNPGLGIGGEKGNLIFKMMLDLYVKKHFVNLRGSYSGTVVKFFSEIVNKIGYVMDEKGIAHLKNISIYPQDYFCPINYFSGKMSITQNTRSIHHYAATWVKQKSVSKNVLQRFSWLKCRFFNEKNLCQN
jgi:mannosyltransferase OCH1-like enzyme